MLMSSENKEDINGMLNARCHRCHGLLVTFLFLGGAYLGSFVPEEQPSAEFGKSRQVEGDQVRHCIP